jgi:hypothetical protein
VTIQFHGTPITPAAQLARMHGEHFCVSFYRPDNADVCETIGASVLWDNGAFSHYTQQQKLAALNGGEIAQIDEDDLFDWLDPRLYHPHRAVVLDVIGGPVDQQRAATKRWPFPRDLSWPVWHLDKPLDYLSELCDGGWSGICLGSAGEYWEIKSPAWERRMDQVFEHLARRGRLPWLHGLRMLGQVKSWPLASADSTNLAQNYGRDTGCTHCKAQQIKLSQHGRPKRQPVTMDMFIT